MDGELQFNDCIVVDNVFIIVKGVFSINGVLAGSIKRPAVTIEMGLSWMPPRMPMMVAIMTLVIISLMMLMIKKDCLSLKKQKFGWKKLQVSGTSKSLFYSLLGLIFSATMP